MRRLIAIVCLMAGASAPARAQAPAQPAAAAPASAPATPAAPGTPGAKGDDPLAALLTGGKGLTADEVAQRASVTSVDARAKEQGIGVAHAKVEETEAAYLPKLAGTARYTRLSHLDPVAFGDPKMSFVTTPAQAGDATNPMGRKVAADQLYAFPPIMIPFPDNQYNLQATLTVPISDYVYRTSMAIAAATHSERAARIDEKAARLKAGADGRVAYYQWIRARGQALIAAQALEQARGHLRDAQQMFTAGLASKADTLRAESQVKSSELLVTRTENGAALAEEQLRVAMHDEDAGHYEIGEDVMAPLPALADAGDLTRLQSEARDKRVELRALDETAGSVKQAGRFAKTAGLPRIDLQGNAVYANPNQRIFPSLPKFAGTWDASVILSWTPTDLVGSHASSKEYKAQLGQIAAQRDALLDGLRLEVTQSWQSLREADLALETTAQGLRAAEEGYRVRNDLYRNGKATLVELNDAQTDLIRARFESINAHIDARIARVRLTHAVGRD
jgi:outer membrane protein TolC